MQILAQVRSCRLRQGQGQTGWQAMWRRLPRICSMPESGWRPSRRNGPRQIPQKQSRPSRSHPSLLQEPMQAQPRNTARQPPAQKRHQEQARPRLQPSAILGCPHPRHGLSPPCRLPRQLGRPPAGLPRSTACPAPGLAFPMEQHHRWRVRAILPRAHHLRSSKVGKSQPCRQG